MPIGVWSTSSTRSIASQPVTASQPCQTCWTSSFFTPTPLLAPAAGSACADLRARRVAGDDSTERPTASSRLVISTSRASVDLPEPLTPVIATSRDSGRLAVTLRRLCSVAPCTVSQRSGTAVSAALALPRAGAVTGRRACSGWTIGRARNCPVSDEGCAARSATPPCATTWPPRLPAPGPMSMMWSARRIVSSSCSTTTSVLPLSPSLRRASSRMRLSRGCRPMVGSSST